MVYTERTDKCTTSTKDNHSSKDRSRSNSQSQGSSSKPSHSSGAWSSQASSSDKWKYNNMVRDDREQFNGMHFS
ncbi:uncharacterized protein DMAD_13500 [Drosophila madeirensis]|uniref:Uncharacterized protein n=1 Tax=Drosophila madeirensis TaxID=30013 RepID=A0AAU9FKN5_DROMD